MKKATFGVPILLIIFRRKDTASQVMDAIARVKPKTFYISQDGPRNKEEEEDVLEVRQAVLSKIDWDCDLKTSFHKTNLGLKKHIPGAFDWFFKDNEYGIYLEDDTLPCDSFFYFQQELLKKFKDDKRIFAINGTNFYPKIIDHRYSYHLSQIGGVWGMGIWRRSWKLYSSDVNDLGVLDYNLYKDFVFNKKYYAYLKFFLQLIKNGKLDTWDYQLAYTPIKNRMYFIGPSRNLIKNIGLNNKSTNLFLQDYKTEITLEKGSNMKHPKKLVYLRKKDEIYFKEMYKLFYIRFVLNYLFYTLPSNIRSLISKVVRLFT